MVTDVKCNTQRYVNVLLVVFRKVSDLHQNTRISICKYQLLGPKSEL